MKNAYRFLTSAPANDTSCGSNDDGDDNFDEFEVWGSAQDSRPDDRRKPIPISRSARKKAERGDRSGGTVAASLPVSIPDWSKIRKAENRGVVTACADRQSLFDYEVGGSDDLMRSGSVIPPHELLWQRRAASFSVHEGIGRTLKGRDLSRVRDAIWQRTGFED